MRNDKDEIDNHQHSIRNHKSAIKTGGVAQLGERLPCTQEVIGSIPFTSTNKTMSNWQLEMDNCESKLSISNYQLIIAVHDL
jgi:hypothetical protein